MASSGLHSSENIGGSRNSASLIGREIYNKEYVINNLNLVSEKDNRATTLNKSNSLLPHNTATVSETSSRVVNSGIPETATAENRLLDPM